MIPPLQRDVNCLTYRLQPAPAGGSGSGGAGPLPSHSLRSNQYARAPGSGAAALVARAAGGDPLPGPRANASRVRLDNHRLAATRSAQRLRRGDGRRLTKERPRASYVGEAGRGCGGTSPGCTRREAKARDGTAATSRLSCEAVERAGPRRACGRADGTVEQFWVHLSASCTR